jgi:gentisate 1,2-dioxygenase
MKAEDAKSMLDAFDREIEKRHIEGLWKASATPPSKEPHTALKPCLWKWQEVYQALMNDSPMLEALGMHREESLD